LGSDPSLDTLEVEILGPLNCADAARELVEKVAFLNISIPLTLTGEWSAYISFRGMPGPAALPFSAPSWQKSHLSFIFEQPVSVYSS